MAEFDCDDKLRSAFRTDDQVSEGVEERVLREGGEGGSWKKREKARRRWGKIRRRRRAGKKGIGWKEGEVGGMEMEEGLCRSSWQTVLGLQVLEGPGPGSEEAPGQRRCKSRRRRRRRPRGTTTTARRVPCGGPSS